MPTRLRWLNTLPILVALAAMSAFARIGGGEHYDSGNSSSHSGGGDGGILVDLLIWLVIRHPAIGIPLLIIVVVVYLVRKKATDGDSSTRKAIDASEAARRTAVSATAAEGWVKALTAKDAQFDLIKLFDRVRREFVELQTAWFKKNLEPVRKYLSDATFQRLVVQMKLMEKLGVRDAVADVQVLDLQIIGLDQNPSFDTIHVRVTAQAHDADAPVGFSDEQALALARKKPVERFTEVWSFVRKPDVQTKVDGDVSQGKCPNCGAPFTGGAANTCEFCGAIVNSGNYDWVLAEITQGSQFEPGRSVPAGFEEAHQRDPQLTTEALEDRASLLFWKWVEAQSLGDPGRLAKVASPAFQGELKNAIDQLEAQGRQKFFTECAVGAVNTQQIQQTADGELAAVEIRWSAKIGVAGKNALPPAVPSQPQRYVMLLERKSGAVSSADHGMSTNRCPNCGAPLTDNGQPSCEFCGQLLSSGEKDWVIRDFGGWEWWRSTGGQTAQQAPRLEMKAPKWAGTPNREERERLVYLMAAMAMADGVVDPNERKLLKMASDRWGVPWANVELALNAPANTMFNKLIVKGSTEAEAFLKELVAVALADGKIDSKERKMLEAAAAHVGLEGRLNEFTAR